MDAIFGIEKLTANNYGTWMMKLEAYLEAKGLWDEVMKEPPDKEDLKKDWMKKNKEVLSIIILTVSTDILPSIKGEKNAKSVWDKLKERYEGIAEERVIDLVFDLNTIKKRSNESIDGYLSRFESLVQEISQLGKQLTDREQIRYIIEGLPSFYDPVVNPILTNRTIKFNELRQMLLTFEKRNESSKHDQALKTTLKRSDVRLCFICKKTGHLKNQCWFNKNKPDPSRNYNKQNNHGKKDKPQQKHGNTASMASEFALSATSNNGAIIAESIWYLDSACTAHMTPDVSLVKEGVDEVKEISVAEDGRAIMSICAGDVRLSTDIHSLNLKDVLVVPKLRDNLISVPKIVQKGHKVIFSKEGAEIVSDRGEIICSGDFKNNMFSIKFNKSHD